VDEKVGRESGGGMQDSQKACMLVSLVSWCPGGRAYDSDLLSCHADCKLSFLCRYPAVSSKILTPSCV
jgi:hypothetical protein